jgi:hypothetical protein
MNILFCFISLPILYYYFGDFYKNIFYSELTIEDENERKNENKIKTDKVDMKKKGMERKNSYQKIEIQPIENTEIRRRKSIDKLDNKDYGHYLYIENEKVMKGDDFYF